MEKIKIETSGISRKHIKELMEYVSRFVVKKRWDIFCVEAGIAYDEFTYDGLLKVSLFYNLRLGFNIQYEGHMDKDLIFNHDKSLSFLDNELIRNYNRLRYIRDQIKKRAEPALDTYIEVCI